MEGFSMFLQILITIGVIAYAVGQWRNGRTKTNSEAITTANQTIDLLTKRADTFSKELDTMKALHRENEIKIAKLEEAIKHKDTLLDQYLRIITNRNPELEQTLKDVRNFLQALNEKIQDGHKITIT